MRSGAGRSSCNSTCLKTDELHLASLLPRPKELKIYCISQPLPMIHPTGPGGGGGGAAYTDPAALMQAASPLYQLEKPIFTAHPLSVESLELFLRNG